MSNHEPMSETEITALTDQFRDFRTAGRLDELAPLTQQGTVRVLATLDKLHTQLDLISSLAEAWSNHAIRPTSHDLYAILNGERI